MIDRKKLIEVLSSVCKYKSCLGKTQISHCLNCDNGSVLADYLIANDVVPVVKCEKCVFSKYIEDSGNYKCTTTKGRFGIVKPYDFCSYGDRRKSK